MPLATLTRTMVRPPASDTPVVANPTPIMSVAAQQLMLWVTDSTTPAGQEYIGTFQYVMAAGSGDGWLFDGPTSTLRLRGAIVDPTPVNGRTYRVLGEREGASYLVRYNDEDHRGDRHRAYNPWSIIGGRGTAPHFSERDTPVENYVESAHYIEVQPTSDDRSSVTEEDLVAEIPVPEVVRFIDNAADGPTRGLAVTNMAGQVALNPERVVGREYLVWSEPLNRDERAALKLAVFTGPADPANNTAGFVSDGYLHTFTNDPSDLGHRTTEQNLPGHESIRWAELAIPERPELTADDQVTAATKAARLRTEARQLEVSFTEFNDALNELAKEKGWCSEYEDIVTSIGMTGRNRKYDVEVSVDFTFDIGSPSSTIDRAVSYSPGMTLELSNLRATSSATVTISDVECEGDTDSMSNYISNSDVQDALESMLSGVDDIEIDDWTVEDYSSSDD